MEKDGTMIENCTPESREEMWDCLRHRFCADVGDPMCPRECGNYIESKGTSWAAV